MAHTSVKLDTILRKTVLVAVIAVLFVAMVVFSKWAFGHAVAINATELEVAALGADLAPNDPHARYGLARSLERTLLPGDQEKAFREYESAVALSPHNYVFWVALGRAREQSGDAEGAEEALRRALVLAPNYARVHWAMGNTLLRQGRLDEGFSEIRTAVAADSTFSDPAAAAAWQIFDGDLVQIRGAIGSSPQINASLAVLLANGKRYREAMEFWRSVPGPEMAEGVKETGRNLGKKLIEGGAYGSAIEVSSAVGLFPQADLAVGSISNGGFESTLTPQGNAAVFSWTIADGAFPRVGLNTEHVRGGSYSLLLSFGQGGKGFRQISQKAAVVPARSYTLSFFYRSDLASGRLRCEIFSPAGDPLASLRLVDKQNWGEALLPFTVPPEVEGIEIRITQEPCSETSCAATGNIWFDEFSLREQ